MKAEFYLEKPWLHVVVTPCSRPLLFMSYTKQVVNKHVNTDVKVSVYNVAEYAVSTCETV